MTTETKSDIFGLSIMIGICVIAFLTTNYFLFGLSLSVLALYCLRFLD